MPSVISADLGLCAWSQVFPGAWGVPGPRDQENASIPAVCALRRSCLCPGTRGNPRTSCPWEGGDTLYLWLCFVVPPLGCSLGFCMHLQVEESPKLRQAHYPACRAGPPPRALRTPRPAQGPRQTERVPASASIHARPYLTSRPSVTWPWSAGLVLLPLTIQLPSGGAFCISMASPSSRLCLLGVAQSPGRWASPRLMAPRGPLKPSVLPLECVC